MQPTHPGAKRPAALAFEATVPRALVHRAAVCEVFPTDSVQLDDDHFRVASQPPRTHSFFSDSALPYLDLALLLETSRQAAFLIAHRHLGVGEDQKFILAAADLRIVDLDALRIGRSPAELVIDVRVRERRHRAGRLAELDMDLEGRVDGRLAFTGGGTSIFLARKAFERLRALGRRDPADGVESSLLGIGPEAVGRLNPRNVVITDPVGAGVREFRADVLVDQGHPSLFDHPLDHVPGMLLVEAYRQTATVTAARTAGLDPRRAVMTACAVRFDGFAELDALTSCRGLAAEAQAGPAGPVVEVALELEQHGACISRGRVEVTECR